MNIMSIPDWKVIILDFGRLVSGLGQVTLSLVNELSKERKSMYKHIIDFSPNGELSILPAVVVKRY